MKQHIDALYEELYSLRADIMNDGEALFRTWLPGIERRPFRFSALNLAYYLAVRCHDLRPVQERLLPLGLSSLGRSEARTMANLDAVMATLGRLCKKEENLINYPSQKWFFHGDKLLDHNTGLIFGAANNINTHIMVTLPPEAADDYKLVRNLLEAGMDTVRINCAHDDRTVWTSMLDNLERAKKETGKNCRVYMDLAGPKIRISGVLITGDTDKLVEGDSFFLSQSIGVCPPEALGKIVLACSAPEVFNTLKEEDPVLIDDGKLTARITEMTDNGAFLTVTATKEKGFRVKPKKSLNFPETHLDITPLTAKDLEDLDFMVGCADSIGYSFVRNGDDIELLQRELKKRLGKKSSSIAIIAKIETKESVAHLPQIIVKAASKQPFGVMIARGDLAVEAGYHRLSELQEEILWICEAAHVPVIWATQVLETLVKTGLPTRAEITDAAMGERAECVILNKGPHIVKAVSILSDILGRMNEHQRKKAPQLRALSIALHTVFKD